MTDLTDTELRHLGMCGDDVLLADAAERLHVSVYTVENHRKAIRRKLGTHTMCGAWAKASRLGIVQ